MKTKADFFFEEFCNEQGIHFEKIQENSREKTPDYCIFPSFPSKEEKVICEVKQIDPNKSDREFDKELKEKGFAIGPTIIPGDRVREKIHKSHPQISARTEGKYPSLLVLYNNTRVSYTDPLSIRVAMYGTKTVYWMVPRDFQPPSVLDRGFGPKRKMTPQHNTAISAIGTFEPFSKTEVFLRIYHNKYAKVPLNPQRIAGSKIRHYELEDKQPGQFQNWQEILPPHAPMT